MSAQAAVKISTRRMQRNHAHAETRVVRIQEEVLEGCLWLAGRDLANRRKIKAFMICVENQPPQWWRDRQHCSLGWWLNQAGVAGYSQFR